MLSPTVDHIICGYIPPPNLASMCPWPWIKPMTKLYKIKGDDKAHLQKLVEVEDTISFNFISRRIHFDTYDPNCTFPKY